ncbi:hypothetical protein [Cryptosporangium phraense]|uniref:Uncharacterized protein n=1 Tax=Cryptosporangium phraense TaxID=2593070 RepID=A0A545AM43_9ACTN|nr:hypothetical protein [Cryptosporangium phraense]TQS42383.1 hypothetical protein FL583_24015 [Cryptosporangium phraense]
MTTLAVPALDVSAPDRGRAMRALARVEARRMLQSPVTAVAGMLFVTPWVYGWLALSPNSYPVLSTEMATTQFIALLVLGSGALITANLATLRPHRHRADEFFDVLVLPAQWRTGALLLALSGPAGLALLLVGVRMAILAALPGAAGRINVFDLLTAPVVVGLLGAVGVLLGRVVRSAIVAPLIALFLVAAAFVLPIGASNPSRSRLLFPTVTAEFTMPVPSELLDRPAGRHLVYVIGLLLVVCVLALLRSGARRVWLAAGIAVTLVVFGGTTQFRTSSSVAALRKTATDDPAALQTCRSVGGVKYCAFDDFTPWIPGWDKVVRDVRAAVPWVSSPGLAVRQRVWVDGQPILTSSTAKESDRLATDQRASAAAGTPDAIPVGTTWGSPPDEAVFAAAVAYRLIAGHPTRSGMSVCGARGALLVWLVGKAAPDGLRELDEQSWNALVFSDLSGYSGISVPDSDAYSGLALLDAPGASATVREHWAELTAPDTRVERFAELTGVSVAAQPPESERVGCER